MAEVKEALPERDLFGGRPSEYILPNADHIVDCQSCGAPMRFVVTANGKRMPLSLKTAETRDGVTYALPHFIDCPQAKEWSRKR